MSRVPSNDLAAVIRRRVAEDLAAAGASDLMGEDRREYARQQIFVHLDELAGDRRHAGSSNPTIGGRHDPRDGAAPIDALGSFDSVPFDSDSFDATGAELATDPLGSPGTVASTGTLGPPEAAGDPSVAPGTGRAQESWWGSPPVEQGPEERWDGWAVAEPDASGWAVRDQPDGVWATIGDTGAEQALAQSVLDALFGMGRLQALIDDPDIENIDINGCDRVWVTFADGAKELAAPVADSDDELVELVKSAASRFGLSERRFDLARPELDLRLPDGSRLSALMAVTARPCVSIRRHRYASLSLGDLVELKTLDEPLARLLRAAVRARKNIVIAGAMNSGKTTLLRALAAEIPPRERIVTIEQAFELGLDADRVRHPDLVALEARPANVEGEGAIPVSDLVRRALRMNADRVIVGEVLGDEVLPMLNAMSQGRSGSMCTIHADSSAGVFRRLASYAVQAPERLPVDASATLIAGAVHLVVYLDDVSDDPEPGRDGRAQVTEGSSVPGQEGPRVFPVGRRRHRFVSSVREVVDAEAGQVVSNEIYCPGPDRRAVIAAPLRPATLDELRRAGYEGVTGQSYEVVPTTGGGGEWW